MTSALPTPRFLFDADVEPAEFARLLGYPPGKTPEGPAAAAAAAAQAWFREHGRAWSVVVEWPVEELDVDSVRLAEGHRLHSRLLAARLRAGEAHAVAVVAASAGPEVSDRVAQLWAGGCPDAAWSLDAYASAVVEQLVRECGVQLCRSAESRGLSLIPPYSPGYEGWDLRDQASLRELLADDPGRPLPGPLEVLSSGMLRPEKSMLTLFGLTRRARRYSYSGGIPSCRGCGDLRCTFRRSPRADREETAQ